MDESQQADPGDFVMTRFGGDERNGIQPAPSDDEDLNNDVVDPNEEILQRPDASEDLNVTLHQAARDGNVERILKLIKLRHITGKKLNQHDENRLTALHYAARFNHYDVCQALLKQGADPNNRGEDKVTPLHYAVRYKRQKRRAAGPEGQGRSEDESEDQEGQEEAKSVVKLLVSFGADVNARDMYGLTPLHYASMRGNEIAVQSLLHVHNIDIEVEDKQQITPLHMAASYNHYSIAKMLIVKGANIRCVDEDQSTPLHYAASEGNLKIVELLFLAGEKKDGWVTINHMVTDTDSEKSTALHLAVDSKHKDVAALIIRKGADVNAHRSLFNTPLHLAAVGGDVDLVRLLIEKHARIEAQNITQSTPLHRAAAYNQCACIEYLLRRKAYLEATDRDSFTPLLTASAYGHTDAIELLLKHGASIEHQDKNEKTALFWAAEEDNVEALNILLKYILESRSGNNDMTFLIDMPDRFGDTALHTASRKGHVAVIKALLEAGADIDGKNEEEQTPLHLAAKFGKTHVCRELVRRQNNAVTDEDENSNTPLHLAALYGHHKAAQVLMDSGANVEARNSVLWTPLDCAASKGHVKVARALVDEDAPIDPMDKAKTTPLHLASRHGHVDMVLFLLEKGADITIRDNNGMNALDLAIDSNKKDVAQAIIKSNHWEAALRNDSKDYVHGWRTTPMRKLIRKMPDVAEQVFTRCTSDNKRNREHPKFTVTFNYEFLEDTYSNWGPTDTGETSSAYSGSSGPGYETYNEDGKLLETAVPYTKNSTILKRNHPLNIMVTSKREDLLGHPLVKSLLRHKWNSYGSIVYYGNLVIYLIFLFFLTGYVCTSTIPFNFNTTLPNLTKCELYASQLPRAGVNDLTYNIFVDIGKYIIMGLIVLFLLREVFQLVHYKLNYFSPENVIEIVMYVTGLLFIIDFYSCQNQTGYREPWQWQCGSVAIFLAWIDLVLFCRKFPRLGIFVVMFTDVLKTFLTFFVVFFLFIIAFGLAFYTLLQNQNPFTHPGEALLKTSVMMIGEFEFDSIFNEGVVHYPIVTYAIFIIFLVIMSIIIMNLLVGLAVDDIKAVQEKATLQRMAMQVDLALDVEGLLPRFISRRYVFRIEKITPNAKPQGCCKLTSQSLSAQDIASSLNEELDPMEQAIENQEVMQKQIYGLKSRMKKMASQTDKIESMVEALMKKMEVTFEESDESEAEDEEQARGSDRQQLDDV